MTQSEYIAILFADCGFNSLVERKAFLKKRFGKEYPDELTTAKRSLVINELKEMKES